jgi:hypothetical protein
MKLLGINGVGFDETESITHQISCIRRQMLEKKWEYNERVHQLLPDFKKFYDRRKYCTMFSINLVSPRN